MAIARGFALIFGAMYTVIGVLGFIGPFTDAPPDSLFIMGTANLLGIFAVNWLHNLVHLATGLFGVATAASTSTARAYARVVGLAYVGLFVIGLFTSNFLGILPLNWADNILHLISAVIALLIGFTDLGLQRIGERRQSMARTR